MQNDMGDKTTFESRTGKVARDCETIYRFVTDMRNFKRFIPSDTIHNWRSTTRECSFEVSPLGKAKLAIVDSEENSMVKYCGDGLNGTEFFLWVQMKEVAGGDSRVKLTIKADLNPVIRMMAAKPIGDFLEKLITGVENFKEWDDPAE